MSQISIKTDFADGEKLFSQQLNNNFLVIQAGINANEENLQQVIDQAIIELDNELEEITADRGWDWNGGDRVTFFKGTTSQVNAQEIKNGQMLYNTETGETALDDNGNRIVTGSGNVVTVSENAPTNPATKEWLKPITINGADTAEEYFRDANNNWKKILCEPSGDTLPIGAITQFSGSVAPTNWLFCNGQAISRTEYSELFAIIGTHYGEGDGSTTFNLPDFIGRVPVGLDAEDPDFDALGDFGGEKTHTLIVDEIPSHNHSFASVIAGTNPSDSSQLRVQSDRYQWGGTSSTTTTNTGNSQPHNIMQPYLVTNFIIKVKQSIGIVGTVTADITNQNTDSVPNTPTVKSYIDAAIEGGENYTKYADGTLICYGKSNIADITYGSEYNENITLPKSYKDTSFVVLVSIAYGGTSWGNVICRGDATSENTIKLIAGNYIVSGSTAKDIVLSYMTIGKWK